MVSYWNNIIRMICKIGKGHHTCAYLGIGDEGLVCLKPTSPFALKMGRNFTMVPLGGNCKGKVKAEMNKED